MLSQIGLFIIFIQPIFHILSVYKAKLDIKVKLIALYITFFLFFLLSFPINFSMERANNGQLAWNWLQFPPIFNFIWMLFCLVLLLYVKQYTKFCIFLIIFLVIYYTYYKTNTWGSLFCWIANIFAIYLIIISFFKLNSSNCLVFRS